MTMLLSWWLVLLLLPKVFCSVAASAPPQFKRKPLLLTPLIKQNSQKAVENSTFACAIPPLRGALPNSLRPGGVAEQNGDLCASKCSVRATTNRTKSFILPFNGRFCLELEAAGSGFALPPPCIRRKNSTSHAPPNSCTSATVCWATSKGGAATKNNRDSRPKFLGVKKFGGQFVLPGDILVRQRGTRFKAGEGVMRGGDDSLVALNSGFVCMRRVYRTSDANTRIKAGCVVSIKASPAETLDPKAARVSFLRTLAKSWMMQGQRLELPQLQQ